MANQSELKSREAVLFGGEDAVEVMMHPIYQGREADLANALGMTAAQREAEQKAFSRDISRSGLDPYELAPRVYGMSVDSRVAIARGTVADEATVEVRERRHAERSRQEVARIYGPAEAEDLLGRLKRYVAQFPALENALLTEDIGSRPDVILPLVEHVRRINFR